MKPWTLLICLIALGACATASKPTTELTNATSALRAAREMGAKSDPQAALHFKLAIDGINRGQALIAESEERFGEARRVLERAEADAELALVLAKAAAAKAEAEKAKEKVSELRAKE